MKSAERFARWLFSGRRVAAALEFVFAGALLLQGQGLLSVIERPDELRRYSPAGLDLVRYGLTAVGVLLLADFILIGFTVRATTAIEFEGRGLRLLVSKDSKRKQAVEKAQAEVDRLLTSGQKPR